MDALWHDFPVKVPNRASRSQVLADQQAGLAHLTKILQKDTRDLDTIAGAAVKEEVSYSTLPSSLNLSSSRR